MPSSAPSNLTRMLHAASAGESGATDQLLPLVYEELRTLAQHQMAQEAAGQTLQPTALVHEAFLRLAGDPSIGWDSRAHFFSAAATAMRRILIERARRHRSQKHGGGRRKVSLDDLVIAGDEQADRLLDLDEAMNELERRDRRKAHIVMLRFFAGLTIDQTAAAMGIAVTTVKDEWFFARAWLHSELARRDAAHD